MNGDQGYPPQPSQQAPGLGLGGYYSSFDSVLLQLELDLGGEEIDSEGRREQMNEPVLTKDGVKDVVSNLRSMINPNLFISNLTREEVSKLGFFISATIAETLYLNSENYKIRKENYKGLVQQCSNIVYAALRRPLGEGERKMIGRTTSVHEITEHRPQEQKGGWQFPKIF